MLKVDQLSVTYGSREILKRIDLNIEPGCVLAVIGPNGAGKSTLIRSISGVVPYSKGSVMVDGYPLEKMQPGQRARYLAVVPQARQIPPAYTALELVAMGRTPYINWLGQLTEKDQAVVHQAMERTGTLEFSNRLVGELSGGEQQRLLLARALAQSAPILLLDEPTTHLDLQYQMGILKLIAEIAHHDRLAVLVVLHDLNLVGRFADRVALLVNGQITSTGSPQSVLTEQNLSQAYHIPLQVTLSGNHPVILPQ